MNSRKFTEEEVLQIARLAYEEEEASFEIEKDKCALIVIDMQEEFVTPHLTPFWVPESTRQIPKVKTLIQFCRKHNIPVIFTAFAKTHDYKDRPKTGPFMPNRYRYDYDDSQLFVEGKILQELQPREDEIVILKPSYGAFYDTPLETILKNLEKDTIIICGTMTNFCCGMTARQAYERSFKVIFGSDITSTDDPKMQEVELKVLRKGFAKVKTYEEIIKVLENSK